MIFEGQVITAADLNALGSTSLTTLRADNATKPSAFCFNVDFNNLVASTALNKRTKTFVIPDDMWLREVSVLGGEHAGIITVSVDSGAMIEPISITGTLTTPGISKLARYYAQDKPAQILLKGTTVAIIVSTAMATTGSTLRVGLTLAGPWRYAS